MVSFGCFGHGQGFVDDGGWGISHLVVAVVRRVLGSFVSAVLLEGFDDPHSCIRGKDFSVPVKDIKYRGVNPEHDRFVGDAFDLLLFLVVSVEFDEFLDAVACEELFDRGYMSSGG
jgi:hypothetical protein